MRKVSSALLLTLLAIAPAVARAQATHPDYSGTFVLDPAQSEGQMVPQKQTLKITQTPAGLTVDRTQTNQMGESTSQMKCRIASGTTGAPSDRKSGMSTPSPRSGRAKCRA